MFKEIKRLIQLPSHTRHWLLSITILLLLLFSGGGFALTSNHAEVEAAVPLAPIQQEEDDGAEETGDGEAADEPAEVQEFINIVVATVPLKIGTRIEPEFVTLEPRLVTNTAVRGNYFIGSRQEVVGRILKTDIAEGQEILEPMLALSATDLPEIGSDLALHISNGQVAIAFPIDRYSGMANAMRPGDLVDVMMSFNLIELDLEFQTPLPNRISLVDQDALERGEPFLFPTISQGRLELIPEIGRVVEVIPQGVDFNASSIEVSEPEQIPRRTTQLTIQQGEVLWVGNWYNPAQGGWQGPNNYSLLPTIQRIETLIQELGNVPSAIEVREGDDIEFINLRRVQLQTLLNELNQLSVEEKETLLLEYGIQAETLKAQVTIAQNRLAQILPDVMIVSLPLQDALTLKWAYEEPGIDIDFVLRSQGDNAVFVTTPVSLPQLVEQAGLAIPEPTEFGLDPYIGGALIPRLPNQNNSDAFEDITGGSDSETVP